MQLNTEIDMSMIETVKSLEDIVATLAVVHNSNINRVYEAASRRVDSRTTLTSQVEVPTVLLVKDKFNLSRQAAYNRLISLLDDNYIEEDKARSYWHYAGNKTYRTIYKLTDKGKMVLKAHLRDK